MDFRIVLIMLLVFYTFGCKPASIQDLSPEQRATEYRTAEVEFEQTETKIKELESLLSFLKRSGNSDPMTRQSITEGEKSIAKLRKIADAAKARMNDLSPKDTAAKTEASEATLPGVSNP